MDVGAQEVRLCWHIGLHLEAEILRSALSGTSEHQDEHGAGQDQHDRARKTSNFDFQDRGVFRL